MKEIEKKIPEPVGVKDRAGNVVESKVVNMRYDNYDVRIDRRCVFGNCFVIGKDGNRELVIKKYKAYFYRRVWRDEEFLNAVLSLRGKRLGCWCKPKACHGDVIVEFLERFGI